MTDTTNAGPVLPEAPYFLSLYDAEIGDAYGRQCWNACDEHVAGPLRERVAEANRLLKQMCDSSDNVPDNVRGWLKNEGY